MTTNKKRRKSVVKKTNAIKGAQKFARDVIKNQKKKAKDLLDRFVRQREAMKAHKANTAAGQLDEIYSQVEEE